MYKSIIIFFLLVLLSGCNLFVNEANNHIENNNNQLDKHFLDLKKESEKENILTNNIKIFSETDINKITEKNLFKFIVNKEITIDYLSNTTFNFDNIKKVLDILNNISNEGKIDNLDLRCKVLDKNGILINGLKELKINKLIINDACLFSKINHQKNGGSFYDDKKIISFLHKTKYIKEVDIGYIEYDKFIKKENGEIKVYRGK